MNIVLVNFSGNVGKSTLCQYLLRPRINAEIFAVETINANEFDDVAKLKGEQFKELITNIDSCENSIIDVGSSNVEDFFEQAKKLKASGEFDFFIIPVTPIVKQQEDTISTIKFLLSLGVNKEKIHVVFNMVDDFDLFERDFSILIKFNSKTDSFDLNTNLIISNNDFYAENKGSGKTIDDIVNDKRNFKELIRISRRSNPELIPELSHERIVQMLARGVKEELEEVFYELFGTNQIGFNDE